MNETHIEKPGCLLDYYAHTKCGRTVRTVLITDGRPSCEDCYQFFFRELMELHQDAVDAGLIRAPR